MREASFSSAYHSNAENKTPLIRSLWIILIVLFWCGVAGGAAIRDLDDLSQDPLSYVDPKTADIPFLPQTEQKRLNAESDLLYFAPWHRTVPYHSKEMASWGFVKYAEEPGYNKEGRPNTANWIAKLVANTRAEDYPQGVFPAITVKRTNFRHLPTHDVRLKNQTTPSGEYPFDSLQVSSAPAGMPVLVTLASRDGKWFLVETNHILGWVPAADIAAVDSQFMKTWENGLYVAIARDKTPVCDAKTILYRAPLGAVFPKAGNDSERIFIWMAQRDPQGKALLRKASVARDAVMDKPAPFTPRNVARFAHELAGEPYGWGGLDGKRDCSGMIRDIFLSFGLWLPRNSSEQAVAGKYISLDHLSSAEKEALIVREGTPWRTLLWVPGHIMLYIGTHQGEPLIFHNFWSIKTRNADGEKGRAVVGRACVTTLHPGCDLRNRNLSKNDCSYNLKGMVILGMPVDDGTIQEAKP